MILNTIILIPFDTILFATIPLGLWLLFAITEHSMQLQGIHTEY